MARPEFLDRFPLIKAAVTGKLGAKPTVGTGDVAADVYRHDQAIIALTEAVDGVDARAVVTGATAAASGTVRLAGDLAGTAAAPTVPALAELRSALTNYSGGGGATATVPPPFADDFNRADQAGIGNGWVAAAGIAARITGGLVGLPATAEEAGTFAATYYYRPPGTYTDDQYAAMDIVTVDASDSTKQAHPEINLRTVVDGSTVSCYKARYNRSGNLWQLYRLSAGSTTLLTSAAATEPAKPYRLYVKVVGSTVTVRANGADVLTFTDTTPLSVGVPMLGLRNTVTAESRAQRIDNWESGALGTVTGPIPSAVVEYTTAGATRPNAVRVVWVWRGTGTPVDPTAAVYPDEIVTPS